MAVQVITRIDDLVDFLKTKLLYMKPLNISEVIGLIEDNKLEELGKFYKVDKANHKITGAFILKSFVRSALLGKAN